MADVKRVGKQAERARRTRQRIVEAARELFVEQGYGSTTLQEVADRAGVAVQTIYFTFGNKRALLKDVVDVAIAGDDEPVATMDRPWFRSALAEPTAEAQLRRHVQGTRKVLERAATTTEVLRIAAAVDPAVVELWPGGADPRFTVQAAAARSLVSKPGVRHGVSAARAADLLYGLLSPELYLVFVRDRGWTPAAWERWTLELLRAQLCAS